MAKKVKEQEVTMEQPVQPAPVVEAAAPVAAQKVLVNCPKCGAGLYADDPEVVYMCPVCNNLMRVRIGERIVKTIR